MAGIIKVDTLQNANASNLVTQTNSTTITIGASGQTVALASGASSSGFGATYNGAVNWDTTPKTTTVTAVSGTGYFIDTTSAAVTVNLPAGSAGSIVALSDYAATWNTNNVTVNANGTEKIGGVASAAATLNTRGQAVTFVYVDSTRGWINTGDATFVGGNTFVAATGGTITTSGDYKIHTFTGPGTFTVTNAGTPAGSNTVEYLVVAGGGAGGGRTPGSAGGASGGGAGGFRQNYPSPATAGLPVTATSYPITVGAGGTAGPALPPQPNANGNSGSDSIFSTITSAGGGGGRAGPCGSQNGVAGGSGSGASGGVPGCKTGGAGNTPPVSPSQGNAGGNAGPFPSPSGNYASAGGGGAGGAGSNAQPGPRAGGPGSANSISGSSVTYSAGGTGGSYSPPNAGGTPQPANSGNGGPGATGCSGCLQVGGTGGSGVVIIRYKYQ